MQRLLLACLLAVSSLLVVAPYAGAAVLQDPPEAAEETGSDADADGAEEEPRTDRSKAAFSRFLDDPVGEAKYWVLDRGPAIGLAVLQFIVILVVFSALARISGRVVVRGLETSRLHASELLKSFASNTTRKVVFFIGLVIALGTVGVDIGPLLAGIGVLGFVVGFALKDTLNNFAAGVMLLLYRPFDVGQYVEVAGKSGTVEAMTLVSTTLLTPDNQRLTIPNGLIWGDVIRNVTVNPTRRVDFTIGIGYDDDIPKAEETLLEIARSHEKVLDDPEPVVKVHELGDSSVNLAFRVWVNTADYWAVHWDVTRQVKLTFDERGIGIPFPQRDVHLHQVQA